MSALTRVRTRLARWLHPGAKSHSKAVAIALGNVRETADEAARRQDWALAANLYASVLEVHPDDQALRVQLAHMQKEAGRLDQAAAGYRAATQSAPDDPGPWIHLAHLLKRMGDKEGAASAFREVLLRDPTNSDARDALIDAGDREHLPQSAYGAAAAAVQSARVTRMMAEGAAGLAELAAISAFPKGDYDAFRHQHPIEPPPSAGGPVTVWIDAADATPALLRATLASLLDQRHSDWRAVVTPADPLAQHSVASLGCLDDRIRFEAIPVPAGATVLIAAGTVLDREALGWLSYALERSGADAVYCDHDHYSPDWRLGLVRHSPRLQSMFDAQALAACSAPPAVAIFRGPPADPGSATASLLALTAGKIAHLPRLLASLSAEMEQPAQAVRPVTSSAANGDARILVIIPTRDEAQMLERSIATLRGAAARPERIAFVVVDNRSREDATAAALAQMDRLDDVEVLPLDEPFNWSRCNNHAASGRSADILVFANNDIEMHSAGWDARLEHWLSDARTGVVGARMTYPDGALQHAGILLGGWDGRPYHEGLGATPGEGGPLNRWRISRQAAAVTGAFMSCTRETFERTGGFDERLAIAYNDLDFCFRARAQGQSVIYAADIQLVHFESRTRGQNDSPDKVAWDDAELAHLYARWREALFQDPGLNPQWVNARNRPFDGLRDLSRSQVLAHLDASARSNPWAIDDA